MKYSQIPSSDFKFYTRTWPASGTPIATVVFVHGFAEHCDRYDHVFTEVAKAGIEVFGFDGRGFGQSATNATAGVNGGWPQQLSDIDHFIASKKQAGIPQFLWGHSMGGGLTLKYAIDGDHRDQLAGIIASAPLIEIPPETRPGFVKYTLGKVAAMIYPDGILPVEVPVTTCTRDPEMIAKGQADELLRPYGSFRGLGDMLAGGPTLLLPENTSRLTLPILLVHGDKDIVTSHLASRKFMEAVASKDKTYKEYPGSYHEIHNDLDRAVVIKDCIDWLASHSKESAKL